MTEKEIYEKIKESAKNVEIPETLNPENMKKTLVQPHKRKLIYRMKWTQMAASFAIICGIGGYLVYQQTGMGRNSGDTIDMAVQDTEASREENAFESEPVKVTKLDAGDMYTVANNYGEVYDALRDIYYMMEDVDVSDGTSQAEYEAFEYSQASSSAENPGSGAVLDYASDKSGADAYSTTNLQAEGVDESDIVKTDGAYIYLVNGSNVEILSVNSGKLNLVSEIELPLAEALNRALEMYIDGDTLCLIAESTQSSLTEENTPSNDIEEGTEIEVPSGNGMLTLDNGAVSDLSYYRMSSKTVTKLYTYDVSDRKNPTPIGTVTQDGSYQDSRKIGNQIYLVTISSMSTNGLDREEATSEDSVDKWIPLVNGEPVAACDIYIPDEGEYGYVISAVDLTQPDEVSDTTLIITEYVDIYVSQAALYLYNIDYGSNQIATSIAKFSLENNSICAVGAVNVPGEITDSFAISEQQGSLRVLTSDWSGQTVENGLYLYDDQLKLTGKLEHLAEGEQIYAARYVGDMAYFVTYRNTDPLFAVDLSDVTSPVVLSELTITGFSEYLHFWGEDENGRSLLFGLGYETDPDTGSIEGLKLAMFDITDPTAPTIAGTCVLKNVTYSPALYQYKTILIDADENLIGFIVSDSSLSYEVYSWESGAFEEKLEVGLKVSTSRGLYIGKYFYVASATSVSSYDMTDGYKAIDEWTYK